MRLLQVVLATCLLCLSSQVFSFSYNSNYYAVYEAPASGGAKTLYIVPKLSILIVASDIDIPIAFMPDVPALTTLLASNGTLGAFTHINKTANDMAVLGATASTYKLFGGDFDGDGQQDLLLQGVGSNESVVIATNLSGNPTTYYSFGTALNSAQVEVSVGDFDFNGRTDVLAAGVSERTTYLSSSNGAWFDTVDQEVGSTSLLGSINGSFRVDERGEATYSVAILSVAGTAGVAPQISLGYSSGGGDGIAGQGWSIGGLSMVSRCRQTLSQDGNVAGISLTATDRFCLDGQRLILTSGTYGANGAVYRTEIDSYAVITSHGGTTGNPEYFTVRRKDGSLSYYGNGQGSSQSAEPGNGSNNLRLGWAIRRFEDNVGNPIKFTYIDDTDGHRISRIDYAYGSNTAASGNSDTYVEFVYKDRPDPRNGYVAGYALKNAKRLSAIRTFGNGSELRSYRLLYRAGTNNAKSYVEKLLECVGSHCLRPTTFTWNLPDIGFSAAENMGAIAGPNAIKARAMDINGDGKADLVYMSAVSPYAMFYRLWNGSSFDAPVALPTGLVTDGNTNWHIFDFNNDGFQDLMVGSPSQNWKLFLGGVAGLTPYGTGGDIGIAYNPLTVLVDLNSDGLPDMVTSSGTTIKYRSLQRVLSGGVWTYQFQSEQTLLLDLTIPPNPPPTVELLQSLTLSAEVISGEMVDYDADGKVDITVNIIGWVYPEGSGMLPVAAVRAILSRDNSGIYRIAAWAGPSSPDTETLKPFIYVDLNGDGLPDQLTQQYTLGYWTYARNIGVGYAPPVTLGSQSDMLSLSLNDYNGDGKLDLIFGNGGSLKARLFNASTGTFETSAIDTLLAFQGEDNDQYLYVDFDGDGHVDLLRINNANPGSTDSSLSLFRSVNAGRALDRIARVNNGFGNITDISYKPMTDASVYTRANDANSETWPQGTDKPYPVFDVLSPSYVVASVSSTAPAAGPTPGAVNQAATSTVSYRYAGAKLQASGRGFLGFGSIKTTDQQSGVTTTTTYRQDFPFLGQPATTEVKTAANVVMKYSTNSVVANKLSGSNGTHYYQSYVDKITELTRDPVTAVETGYTETTASIPDVWGNMLGTTTSIYASSGDAPNNYLTRKTVANSYGGSDYEYQFGRLSRSVVTHKRHCPGSCADIVRVSEFTYYDESAGDMRGLLKTEAVVELPPGGSERTVLTTTNEYDGFGNKTKVIQSAAGLTDRYTVTTYDLRGRYSVTGSSPFFNGSSWADQVSEHVVSRNAYGAPLEVRGLNGVVTLFTYDALGRETSRSDNAGAALTTTYSTTGLVAGAVYKVIATASTGATSSEYFDALGRSVAKTSVAFDGRTVYTETEYDKTSRVRRQSQPHYSGATTYWLENTYDDFGRPLSQSSPAPHGGIATSTFTYNGLYAKTTNPAGQTREEWRNTAGELIRVDDYLGGRITYQYDAAAQLVLTRALDSAAAVAVETHVVYDPLGRKIKMIDANKGTWFYLNNDFGEMTDQYKVVSSPIYSGTLSQALSDPAVLMQRTHMQYDRRGRMVARTDYRANGTQEGTAAWVYDTASNGVGLPVSESGGGLTRTFSYDNRGRLVATLHADGDGVYMQSVSYDAFGRALEQTDALGSGSGTHNTYNGFGYLQTVTDLDTGTLLYQVQNMDQRGNVTTAVLGNGATSTWSFDDYSGLLLNQTVIAGVHTLQDLSYTWDVLGNQASRRDQGLISVASNTYRDLKQSFCYDGLNRLIKTHQGSLSGGCSLTPPQQDQEYDDFGNIVRKAGIGAYSYMSGQPHTLQSTGDGVSYTYDNTGNLTADSGGRALQYSVFDKPLLISKGVNQIAFGYSADRTLYKRVDTDTGNSQTTTTYTIGGVEKVIKPDGSYDLRRYVAGVALWTHHFNGVGVETSLDKQYLYKDVLGSIVLITDHLAAIKNQSAFDEWGRRVALTDWQTLLPASTFLPIAEQFTNKGFTGHEMLDAVGLIHMQGRIYDARLGRFVQADPFVQDGEDLQAFNRYAYVRNNPLTLTDPSGYFWLAKKIRHTMRWLDPITAHTHENTTEKWLRNSANLRMIGSVIMGILDGTVCYGICSPAYSAHITDLVGGSGSQGLSAAAFSFAGSYASSVVNIWLPESSYFINVVANGFVGGVMSSLQGGEFGNGFAVAGLGAGMSIGMSKGGWSNSDTSSFTASVARISVAAIVGGTSSKLTGGKFANGASSAAFLYTLRELPNFYRGIVGYDLDMGPGGDAVGKKKTERPVKGANNVGVQKKILDPNCAFCEGGNLSRGLNVVPGINATAGMHDMFQVSMGKGVLREILNVPGMPVAATITYAAYAGQYLQGLSDQQLIYLSVAKSHDDEKEKNVYNKLAAARGF